MVNESKNMYIPEDTLENHQGMLSFRYFFFFICLVTSCNCAWESRAGEGCGGEGGGGDLETGMGWGKERWWEVEGERERKGREGVLA